MFCCTKNSAHQGQIVSIICLEQQCMESKNQLSCAVCVQEQHQGHALTTLRKILPDLLICYKEKERLQQKIGKLFEFVTDKFGERNSTTENVTLQNVVDRAIQIMNDMKSQVETNNQEFSKMKDIFKNLNKNVSQSSIPSSKLNYQNEEKFIPHTSSVQQISTGKLSMISNNFGSTMKSPQKSGLQTPGMSIDTFSHSLKHPYLSLSTDCHTVTKSSHPGHRYSVLSSKSLSFDENEVNVKIDVSLSGNIMIGLCHESIVRQKDFINNYGINHGTYLIGQNGGNSQTAISFHHSSNIFNRKQMVGWNFKQGEVVTVGYNFNEQFIYFKLNKQKGKTLEFDMALMSEDYQFKQHILSMLSGKGLKVIVLLQNIGDRVTLMEA